jgi:uncharacterized membrane protein (DUF2068 family)
MSIPGQSKHHRTNVGLVVIGVFKLVKSTLLLGLGIGLLLGRDRDLGQIASRWVNELSISHSIFDNLLAKLSSLQPRTLEHVAAGSFVYSALFVIEGVGLCRQKRWAEILTVMITASLLPFELYELLHRITATGVIITVANVAILIYLLVQLVQDRHN